jgi:hypothetical protein
MGAKGGTVKTTNRESQIMKTLLIALAVISFGMASSVEAKSFWKTNIQFQKDGMKTYSKTCTEDGQQCGNWNVKG